MTRTTTPARLAPVSAHRALLAGFGRAWKDATPTDRYTRAAGIRWLEPIRAHHAGHTHARLVIAGDAVALSTFDRDGTPLDRVAWDFVTSDNVARVQRYIARATADALAVRGEDAR